jgi:hypothetical protein
LVIDVSSSMDREPEEFRNQGLPNPCP